VDNKGIWTGLISFGGGGGIIPWPWIKGTDGRDTEMSWLPCGAGAFRLITFTGLPGLGFKGSSLLFSEKSMSFGESGIGGGADDGGRSISITGIDPILSIDLRLSGVCERVFRIDGGFESGDFGDSTLKGGFGVSDRDFGDFGVCTIGVLEFRTPSIDPDRRFKVVGFGDEGRVFGFCLVA
jgi:hypothetical protein